MALNPPSTSSSTCCDACSCSQRVRDLQEQETDDSHVRVSSADHCCSADDSVGVDPCCQSTSDVPAIDQGSNQENQNTKAAKGCCEVEESKHKEGRLTVEDDKYHGEERKPCCGVDSLNRESCCEATRDAPPSNDDDLKGDNYCEDDTTQRTSCCDLGFLKQLKREDGVCCDGK